MVAATRSACARAARRGWLEAAAAIARGLGLAVLLAGAGCATPPPKTLVLPPSLAPLPRPVVPGQELAAAEAEAACDRRDFALLGTGASMEPLYRGGTAIVVRETGFRSLRAGQAVVYRHPRGYYVAHVLLAPTAQGWLVAGLAAKEPDAVKVTPANFVGVIRAAYAAMPSLPAEAWGGGVRTAGGP
jgi:hypothetical protein